ncbi:1-acyl-sn-glycerol-3-phosphate acyltransferase [Flammeovirga pectinis]|uniref:1-acyl-sn-glycerol-3-phosphate acyltransferase n=1 Tax=Flammeovirga pectinis TaxID=2494373 RepID=A0A3Q9FTZ8_9BACT|nr:1-acyl-sn-glycerol-3-phosphate acyltransferase [Flammeovirga pectinis]
MTFILRLYMVYGVCVFSLGLLILYPLYIIIILSPNKRLLKFSYYLNKLWSTLTYILIFIPARIDYRAKLSKDQAYVFVANHSSFLDIPAVQVVVNQMIVFLGKKSLTKIPLFGWMFKNIHICVDRGNAVKTEKMFRQSIDALDKGFSIGVFPEGTQNRKPPVLQKFKDGAFIIAIRAQKPVVPVTLVTNWKIWPALGPTLHWHPLILIQHEPISTEGMTLDDVKMLKEKVKNIIEGELINHLGEAYTKKN